MSSGSKEFKKEDLPRLYQKLMNPNYSDWNDYVNTKNSIYVIRPSSIYPNVYFCSCPVGCKKHACKHSVHIMQYVKKTLVNPYHSTPFEKKRKPGRPSLAKNALSIN
jgi:hypothetical protein